MLAYCTIIIIHKGVRSNDKDSKAQGRVCVIKDVLSNLWFYECIMICVQLRKLHQKKVQQNQSAEQKKVSKKI